MKMLHLALLVVVCTTVAGCNKRRSRPEKTPTREGPAPIKIDWSDPGSVTEGFFDAKKRGDWRKAFNCCDYAERLDPKEAEQIRNEWKKDAPSWPARYLDSQWFIADAVVKEDLAIVTVVLVRSGVPGTGGGSRTVIEELCKRYGDRWKITEFEAPSDRSPE